MSHSAPPDVINDFTRVAPALIKAAAEYPASILADVAGRRGTLEQPHRPARADDDASPGRR